jgi:hypothetical protein
MSKMGSHDSFKHLKYKLWSKERLGIKLTIWLPTSKKSGINPTSLRAGGMPHTFGKLSKSSTIFLQTSSQSEVCTQSYGGPKVARVPTLRISELPFGSPGTKCDLDVGLMKRHKIYYRGEGGGFPQVRAMVSLVSPSLPVPRPSTKNAQIMH